MKLIAALFSVAMALMFTWVASWLAVDVEHAWKVVTAIGAVVFGFVAIGLFIDWTVDHEGEW